MSPSGAKSARRSQPDPVEKQSRRSPRGAPRESIPAEGRGVEYLTLWRAEPPRRAETEAPP